MPLRRLPNVNHRLDFHGALVLLLEGESGATPRVQVRANAGLLQPRGARGRRRRRNSPTVIVNAASDMMNYMFNCVHLIPLIERCD